MLVFPLPVPVAVAADYTYNGATNTDWATLTNWTTGTKAGTSDNAFITANVGSISSGVASVYSADFSNGAQWGSGLTLTVATTADFNDTSYTRGTINGDAIFHTTYYGVAPSGGVFTIATGKTYYGTVNGTVYGTDLAPITSYVFNGTSSTWFFITINGDAVFNDTSRMYGTINGDATFHTTLYGSGVAPSGGVFTIATGKSWDITVNGTVYGTDLVPITSYVLNGASFINSGTINGDATFNGTSYIQGGTINGDATFHTTYYGVAPSAGVFTIATGKVYYPIVNGTVYGTDLVPITSYVFNGSGANAGTINGDATFNDTSYNATTINGSVVFNSAAANQRGTINAGVAGTVTGNFSTTSGITFQSGTVSSNISGTGGVTKSGAGTVTLSGVNTYTGKTTLSQGILKISTESGIGGNPGALTADQLTLNGGTLQTTSTFSIDDSNRGVTLGASGGTISPDNGTTLTIGSIIAGSGDLIKAGLGTMTLSGTNAYTGATAVSAGTLIVTGAIEDSSLTTVSSGATIGGSGTTGALTLNGILSPGASPGTLSTVGDTTYAGGGSYTWEINDATGMAGTDPGWDLHDVTGGLTITATSANKFTVDVTSLTLANASGNAANFNKLSNYAWEIATASGGVTGFNASAFAVDASQFTNDVTGSIRDGYFGIQLSGTDLEILYYAAVNETQFATGGQDGNASAVGGALDSVVNPSGDMKDVLNTLYDLGSAELNEALETMTPDMSTGAITASRGMTRQFLGSVSNRLGYARSGMTGIATGDMFQGAGFWVQGLGSHMKQDTRKGIEGYQANVFGTSIGADKLLTNHIRAGLAGGYGFANVNSKTAGSPSDSINSWNGTLYGSFDSSDLCKARNTNKNSKEAVRNQLEDNWYVDGMMGFTQNNYDSRREIWLTPSNARVAKADHHSQQYSTKFETGYTFLTPKTKHLEITPFTSLQYSYLYMNEYKEDGADALNLNVNGEGYHELLQSLGMKFAYPVYSKNFGTFIPSVKVAWLYDYVGDKFESTSSFAGGGSSFTTRGAEPAKHGLLLGGELVFLNKGNMTLTANYDLELKDEFASHTYYLTCRLDF